MPNARKLRYRIALRSMDMCPPPAGAMMKSRGPKLATSNKLAKSSAKKNCPRIQTFARIAAQAAIPASAGSAYARRARTGSGACVVRSPARSAAGWRRGTVLDHPPPPIRLEGAERRARARRPGDLDRVHLAHVAETEVLHQALLGQVRGAGVHLACLPAPAGVHAHAGADGVAIRARTGEHELEPVVRAALVAEQLGRLVVVAQDEVELAVAVEVGDRQPAAVLDAVGGVDEGHVRERAVAVVPEQDVALVAVQAVLADVEESARLLL